MATAKTYAFSQPALMFLDRVCNRWSASALAVLSAKPMRFNQLGRELGTISQKMLSQTLKGLERDGLVNRKVTPTVPITVEYSITELGLNLIGALEVMQGWLDANYSCVLEAQQRFDEQRVEREGWPSPTRLAS